MAMSIVKLSIFDLADASIVVHRFSLISAWPGGMRVAIESATLVVDKSRRVEPTPGVEVQIKSADL